jgi:hypothetical protein
MSDIDLGPLAQGPHAELIRTMARLCAADATIQAIWVGGSLAAGTGDTYSDVDFRIAVEPGQLAQWSSPAWERYLPLRPSGALLLRFGEHALLHHLVLADGTIVDVWVQDTTGANHEPHVVILACRDAQFRQTLEGFARPADALVRAIDGAVCRQFFVDYWITTHKQMKALARKYDLSAFSGLFMERMPLLRAWYMQAVGKDLDGRPTLHLMAALHRGLAGKLTADQQGILGMPSRTPAETAGAIEAIRAEMARVGRWLADQQGFAYPHELEAVVWRFWNTHKETGLRR